MEKEDEREREAHISLRYVGELDEHPDRRYNKITHRWWFKCRSGTPFLKYRKKWRDGELTRECLRCGEQEESLAGV